MFFSFAPRRWYAVLFLLSTIVNGVSLDFFRPSPPLSSHAINGLGHSIDISVAPESNDEALQQLHHYDHIHGQSRLERRRNALVQRDIVTLRILCLGSSVMAGYGSTDYNGFRYNLRSQLVADGHLVHMVGSRNIGSMSNDNVEGWGGYRIDQVSAEADNSLPTLPNVACILAGANDVYQNFDIPNMSNRMGQFIDKIVAAVPGITVIVSTLPPNNIPADEVIMQQFNQNLTTVVGSRAANGTKVFLVNCSSSWWSTSDLPNNNHPDDLGYLKMARVFYDGIVKAKNVITAPLTPAGGENDTTPPDVLTNWTCPKTVQNEDGPYLQANYTGSDDGPYIHSQTLWTTNYDLTSLHGGGNSSNLFWADINGDGLDDLVNMQANMQLMTISLNNGGGGTFGPAFTINIANIACPRSQVVWADMNADGKSDLCCIGTTGAISCATNRFVQAGLHTFPNLAAVLTVPVTGYPGSRYRLADIDGDGRADAVVINPNGDLLAWRNAGTDPLPSVWQSLGLISSGRTFSDPDGIRLIDINGDGRADLLWMDPTAKVSTWINYRGSSPYSLGVAWNARGVTHPGTGVVGSRSLTTFGKIMGTTMNDPIYGRIKSDMVLATDTPGGDTHFRIYRNTGVGGTTQKGDGVRFCDMRGAGIDDFLWVAQNGAVSMYGNVFEIDYVAAQPPQYTNFGVIFQGNTNRRNMRFADFDGDGLCDILIVDKVTGAVTMWKNNFNGAFPFTQTPTFTNMGVVSGLATCNQGYGIGLTDMGVHIADITGDGKADYMCVQNTGATTAWQNNGLNNFLSLGTILVNTYHTDRADIRFADIDGDGRADYITLDKFSGAMYASINNNATNPPTFTNANIGGVLSSPAGRMRGSSIVLAKVNGTGRADYITVDPPTSISYSWHNFCPGAWNMWGPLKAPKIPLPIDPSNPLSGLSNSIPVGAVANVLGP